MSLPFAHILKFTILGDKGVGKSCLEQQFTERTFKAEYEATIGVEFGARTATIDGRAVRLQIWDAAGHESFRNVAILYVRGAAGVILVYDITRRETFEHLATWLGEARKQNSDRDISYEESERFAKEHGLFFVEASAKTQQKC